MSKSVYVIFFLSSATFWPISVNSCSRSTNTENAKGLFDHIVGIKALSLTIFFIQIYVFEVKESDGTI